MKRRKFIQGLFATVIAAPVIVKAVTDEPFSETVDGWVKPKEDLSFVAEAKDLLDERGGSKALTEDAFKKLISDIYDESLARYNSHG